MKLRRHNYRAQDNGWNTGLHSFAARNDQPSLENALIVHQLDRYRGLCWYKPSAKACTHELKTAHSIRPVHYHLELDAAIYSEGTDI